MWALDQLIGIAHPTYKSPETEVSPSLSAMFNSLHSNTNQELFESASVIKVATIENMGSHHMQPPNQCLSLLAKMTR